tara:strand:+ start:11906 stop:13402 length:1497 start_codon:yes stop_codon:yes gene_type:complete
MNELESMVIDINPGDTKSVINLNNSNNEVNLGISDKPSVNFGGGIELLMNEKKKSSSADIGLGELSDLENELNDLTDNINKKSLENSRSNLFKNALNSVNDVSQPLNVQFKDIPLKSDHTQENIGGSMGNLGEATVESFTENKTWDGYGKYSNVPITTNDVPLSKEELTREKFKYLRRLEDLERKGASLTKKYSMDSPLAELQGEYEMIISEREKANSVKFQGRMLMAAITGLEFLNSKFDPFDLKMDGWAEQVNENINDYDEIFSELHEKYKSKAKMAPELKLLFQLGGSAIMVHMTNTMFKSSMPGMDDIMKQNPELMQQFTQAAVNSMGETNPGFGNFMNSFMPGNSGSPPPVPNMGPPPPSVNTQSSKSQRYAPPQNRPDLMSSRTQEGISIQEKFAPLEQTNQSITSQNREVSRQEMKGPGDISQLLSGLKTKQVNIPPSTETKSNVNNSNNEKDSSTISIQDLKELNNQKIPKSNRKQKPSRSERNTISLDL